MSNPTFIVDGLDDADSFAGDGHLPPFCIFIPDAQDYLPITFQNREEAQKIANFLNSFVGTLSQSPFAVRDRFRAAMSFEDWLETVSVHSPSMWKNESGPKDWYAVSVDDEGIIAYFQHERDACRFRLDWINRQLNP
jgi:hypothetical protein